MAAGSAITMKILSIAIGVPVGILTKKAVERAWVAARPANPPRKAKQRGVVWADAIGWAALSGAGAVVGQLVTQRSAEAAFRTITGNEPPPPKPAKAEKKAAGKAAKELKKAGKDMDKIAG